MFFKYTILASLWIWMAEGSALKHRSKVLVMQKFNQKWSDINRADQNIIRDKQNNTEVIEEVRGI